MTRYLARLLKSLETKASPPDWIWENPDKLWARLGELAKLYENKKKECEAAEKLLNEYREQLARSRVSSRT